MYHFKLEITSTLPTNQDSVYILEFNHDLIQTYTRLDVSTDCGLHTKVSWDTDYQYRINTDWVSLVNPSSMTDEFGKGSIIFGVWEEFIGTTITVYGGYTDECNHHHLDSIQIKID